MENKSDRGVPFYLLFNDFKNYIKELINKNFNFASLFKAHAGWWAYTSKV